jgi:hypothetical protein
VIKVKMILSNKEARKVAETFVSVMIFESFDKDYFVLLDEYTLEKEFG